MRLARREAGANSGGNDALNEWRCSRLRSRWRRRPSRPGRRKQYGPGVTDSEIKIGQSTPLSGPASAFGIYSRVEEAYFKSLNEKGGINGRKIKFIVLDNGFNPPKALEASRKLVEEDGVLAEVGTVGTPTNSATQKYLNGKKVPQLLVSAGGSKFNDPKQYPWTVPFYPSFEVEAIGYARYALKAQPNAKIAVLYQNDDYGKDFLKGLKKGLGEQAPRRSSPRRATSSPIRPSIRR